MTINSAITQLSRFKEPKKTILFLGYKQTDTRLIDVLIENNCNVDHCSDKIDGSGSYDLVVSFGYRHIISKEVIDRLVCPIFNLHISYLPFNRGAHPNFWSFYDGTPSGVTIHLIDDGVDTGPIVFQKRINFKLHNSSFVQTHAVLISEIEQLFIDNVALILTDKWTASAQIGKGTHHFVKDLPSDFSGWSANIKAEITRLKDKGSQNE